MSATLPTARRPCRHCGRLKPAAKARRLLCRDCHAVPSVRRLYPCAGPLARQSGGRDDQDFSGPAPLPDPCDVRPGPDKVPVLCQRAARKQALFHPDEPTLRLDADALCLRLRVVLATKRRGARFRQRAPTVEAVPDRHPEWKISCCSH